jgi:hypothetical protein
MKDKIDARIETYLDSIIQKEELTVDDLSMLIFFRREICMDEGPSSYLKDLLALMETMKESQPKNEEE